MTTLFEKDDGNAGLEELEAAIRKSQIRLRMRERASAILSPLAAVVALIAIWELLTRLFEVPTYLIPRPGLVALALSEHFELILKESWVTTSEILLGYALSIVVGIPLALAIFLWPPFARAIYPLLVSSQAMPKVAVAPLLIVWFGFGLLPKVLIAFLIAFFPIVINTMVGFKEVDRGLADVFRSVSANERQLFMKLRLPYAMPYIFAGLRIATTLSVLGAIVAEWLAASNGLGYLVLSGSFNFNTARSFAAIIALAVIGTGFFALMSWIERLVSWKRHGGNDSTTTI